MNRLLVCTKRILHRKLYLLLLGLLTALTVTYRLLPEQSKSTEIRVAVCAKSDDIYTQTLMDELSASGSLYRFYAAASESDIAADVQSGYAECGFVIPEGFFDSYIRGDSSVRIRLCKTNAGVLSQAISETFFHFVFKAAAPQILVDTIGDPSLDAELKSGMEAYMESDTIFRMSSVTSGTFDYAENTYRVDLPIQEFACILLIFSGLFALMLFLQDEEHGFYAAFPNNSRRAVKYFLILAALTPTYAAGILCCLIAYGTSTLPRITVVCALTFAGCAVLSLFVKKSRTLAVLLPILLFLSIVYFMLNYLI